MKSAIQSPMATSCKSVAAESNLWTPLRMRLCLISSDLRKSNTLASQIKR